MKWTIDNTKDVWKMVTKLHSGQHYGGTAPGEKIDYINHIGSVVFEVLAALPYHEDIDEDLVVKCAMLHDTIEDTSATYQDIHSLFGEAVAKGVMALTKDKTLGSKSEQMLDSLQRIREQPKEVWMVKMADRITNLYAPPYYWNTEKKVTYQEEARLIYNNLKDSSEYLAERLKSKIEGYQKYINQT